MEFVARPDQRHVVLTADHRYAQHAAVVIISVLERSSEPARLQFWLITDSASAAAFQTLVVEVVRRGARIVLLPIDDAALPRVAQGSRYPKAALYRLICPLLLPKSVTRVLYLDPDVLVRRDVAELCETELGENELVAAVANAGIDRAAALGLSPNTGYFNAGVMIVNVSAWRRARVGEAVLAFLGENRDSLMFYDQDALNVIVGGRWRRLDARWNQQYEHFLAPPEVAGLDAAALRQVQREPYIVHFTGACKPWDFRDDHPFKREYFLILDKTPFRGWRPSAAGFSDWSKWAGRKLIPFRARPWLHQALKRTLGAAKQRRAAASLPGPEPVGTASVKPRSPSEVNRG